MISGGIEVKSLNIRKENLATILYNLAKVHYHLNEVFIRFDEVNEDFSSFGQIIEDYRLGCVLRGQIITSFRPWSMLNNSSWP